MLLLLLLFAAERRTRDGRHVGLVWLGRRQLVVSADDVTVDDAVPVAGDQSAVAGGTGEALDVVDGCRLTGARLTTTSGRTQHHLAGWDVLTTAGAHARRAKHSAHDARHSSWFPLSTTSPVTSTAVLEAHSTSTNRTALV